MNAILIRDGDSLGDCHPILNSCAQKTVSHSKNLRPLGDCFRFSAVLDETVVLFVSALRFASCPSNVSGSISGVVIDPINAELPDGFRALPYRRSNIVPEGAKVGPFIAHGYSPEEVAMCLLEVRSASSVHINPSRIKNGSFLRILVLPMLRKPGSGAFNLPATTAFHGLKLMAEVVLRLSAITKAFPYRVSLMIEACKIAHEKAMKTLSEVVLDAGRNFHSPTICGLPQIVN